MKKMKKIKFGAKISKLTRDNALLKNILSSVSAVSLFRYKLQAKNFGFLLLSVFLLLNFGCQSPSLKANSSKSPMNAAEDNVSSLEKDLQTMRNADFDFIYVFRRKDGGVFDSEDKKYLKANSPVFTNRFILTDEDKAAIAGSGYKFEPENLENLQKRFVMENFSKPETQQTPANQNSGKQ